MPKLGSFGAVLTASLLFTVLAVVVAYWLDVKHGMTIFVLTPLLAGFIAGRHSGKLRAALQVLLSSALIMSLVLFFSGLEGVVCIVMALPLAFVTGLIGAWIAHRFRKNEPGNDRPRNITPTGMLSLLLVGCSGAIERPYVAQNPNQSVETTQTFAATREKTWDALLQFQQVDGDKPFLLSIGLPVPTYCTIDGQGVGATRICHFEQGTIEERISAWSPPADLGMEITKVTLPGRTWLKFVDASYHLEAQNASVTVVRRITRYNSELRPRMYWNCFEQLGTQAEHEYLFNALRRKLARGDT